MCRRQSLASRRDPGLLVSGLTCASSTTIPTMDAIGLPEGDRTRNRSTRGDTSSGPDTRPTNLASWPRRLAGRWPTHYPARAEQARTSHAAIPRPTNRCTCRMTDRGAAGRRRTLRKRRCCRTGRLRAAAAPPPAIRCTQRASARCQPNRRPLTGAETMSTLEALDAHGLQPTIRGFTRGPSANDADCRCWTVTQLRDLMDRLPVTQPPSLPASGKAAGLGCGLIGPDVRDHTSSPTKGARIRTQDPDLGDAAPWQRGFRAYELRGTPEFAAIWAGNFGGISCNAPGTRMGPPMDRLAVHDAVRTIRVSRLRGGSNFMTRLRSNAGKPAITTPLRLAQTASNRLERDRRTTSLEQRRARTIRASCAFS